MKRKSSSKGENAAEEKNGNENSEENSDGEDEEPLEKKSRGSGSRNKTTQTSYNKEASEDEYLETQLSQAIQDLKETFLKRVESLQIDFGSALADVKAHCLDLKAGIGSIIADTSEKSKGILINPSEVQERTEKDIKEKCSKFLANLLGLSSREPKSVERNIRTLIQELIDNKVEPENFCDKLERLLNASPQPCLIGFLKKSLPLLRHSLVNNELTIDGIRPPPSNFVFSATGAAPAVQTVVRAVVPPTGGGTAVVKAPAPVAVLQQARMEKNSSEKKLLPVEMMQAQVCSECSHYLTVLPITQLENGQILCGRADCQKKGTPGTPSLLNVLMASFKYRCVNYLDGCKELLTSATSKNHEDTCKFTSHDCFFCSYKGNGAQIIGHLKTVHPVNITATCRFSFEVGLESSQKFIYLDGEEVCVVSVKTSSKNLAITFEIVNSSSDVEIKQSTFKFYEDPYSTVDQHVLVDYSIFHSKSKNFFELDMEQLMLCFKLGTELTCEIMFDSCGLSAKETELEQKSVWLKQLMHDLSKQQKSLTEQKLEQLKEKANQEEMSKCLRQLTPKIYCCEVCNRSSFDEMYTCERKHLHCKTCMKSKTAKDNRVCIEFKQIRGLSKIYVPCEWDRCTELISLNNYLNHRGRCSQRPYKCPVKGCFVQIYSSKALEEHWHSAIKLVNSEFIEFDKYGHYELFWIKNHDLYKICVEFLEDSLMVDIDLINISQSRKLNMSGYYETTWYRGWNQKTERHFCDKYVLTAPNKPSRTKLKIELVL